MAAAFEGCKGVVAGAVGEVAGCLRLALVSVVASRHTVALQTSVAFAGKTYEICQLATCMQRSMLLSLTSRDVGASGVFMAVVKVVVRALVHIHGALSPHVASARAVTAVAVHAVNALALVGAGIWGAIVHVGLA